MTKFFAKVLAFLVLFGIVAPLGILRSGVLARFGPGSEVYLAIAKSRKHTAAKRILIGDSVANQLYPAARSDPYIYAFACSESVSLAGRYFMLRDFIARNDMRGTTVYLVYTPLSFNSDLQTRFTFHYFIKPFVTINNWSTLDAVVRDRVARVPWYWTAWLPIIKVSRWSPDYAPSQPPNPQLSEISRLYLQRIRDLAQENGFEFIVLAPVLAESRRQDPYGEMQAQIQSSGLGKVFSRYFGSMRFLPDSAFSDGVHLHDPGSLGPNPLNL